MTYRNFDMERRIEVLTEQNKKLFKERKELQRSNKIKDKYCELIVNTGFDYDGLKSEENLKLLINELVRFAKLAIDENDSEVIFNSGGSEYNIMLEEINESKEV